MANYTKKRLMEYLKHLMKTKPIDKISVTEIVEGCQVNRQTFYYHFQDIYDLLGHIYKTEALGAIEDMKTYENWQKGLLIIFEYVKDNLAFCVNTYKSIGRDYLFVFLRENVFELLEDVIDEIPESKKIPEDKKDFIVHFYSYAFTGVLIEWMLSGAKASCEEMVENINKVSDGGFISAIDKF